MDGFLGNSLLPTHLGPWLEGSSCISHPIIKSTQIHLVAFVSLTSLYLITCYHNLLWFVLDDLLAWEPNHGVHVKSTHLLPKFSKIHPTAIISFWSHDRLTRWSCLLKSILSPQSQPYHSQSWLVLSNFPHSISHLQENTLDTQSTYLICYNS